MEIEVRNFTYDDGTKADIWYKKGDLYYYHRENGPAYIEYAECMEIIIEEWYYYNKEYIPEKMPLNLFLNYIRWEYRKNGK